MKTLFLLVLLPLMAIAQVALDDVNRGTRVEIERVGETITRTVVGLPSDRMLAEDADFVKRAAMSWVFVGGPKYDNVRCWMAGDFPFPGPQRQVDLVSSNTLLCLSRPDYRAAPALGDSLYYLHADPRTVELVDGVHADPRG